MDVFKLFERVKIELKKQDLSKTVILLRPVDDSTIQLEFYYRLDSGTFMFNNRIEKTDMMFPIKTIAKCIVEQFVDAFKKR